MFVTAERLTSLKHGSSSLISVVLALGRKLYVYGNQPASLFCVRKKITQKSVNARLITREGSLTYTVIHFTSNAQQEELPFVTERGTQWGWGKSWPPWPTAPWPCRSAASRVPWLTQLVLSCTAFGQSCKQLQKHVVAHKGKNGGTYVCKTF